VRFDPLPLLIAQPKQVPAHDPNPLPKTNQDRIVRAEKLMSSDPSSRRREPAPNLVVLRRGGLIGAIVFAEGAGVTILGFHLARRRDFALAQGWSDRKTLKTDANVVAVKESNAYPADSDLCGHFREDQKDGTNGPPGVFIMGLRDV
jgi:hypothetical protein